MNVFVVTSLEASCNCDACSSRVCGVFRDEQKAIRAMRIVRDATMRDFEGEYVEFEDDEQVVMRNRMQDNYVFKVEVTKVGVSWLRMWSKKGCL